MKKPAAAQRVHRCDLLKGRLIDLRRQRELHWLQNYGLRRSVPRGLTASTRARTCSSSSIHPDECIDCGVCEPECPVDAIKPDTEDDADGKWLRVNTEYAKVWPNITVKGEPPADAEAFERETGKFEKYFSEKPGRGS